MVFHTFGNGNGKTMMLIHGMLTPWQIWKDAAEYFAGEYFVVVPELDAHTEDEPSAFVSIEDKAEQVAEYAMEHFGGRIDVLCGLSMGGRIAAEVAGMPDISVGYLVLDGAPLIKFPGFVVAFLKRSYASMLARTKQRDPKTLESCRRNFLPDRYMDHFLKIADNMDIKSVDTILDSVFSDFEFQEYDPEVKILFMHGTKGNEMFSCRSALRMKEVNPQTKILCFPKYAHAQLACFEIEKWTAEVARFVRE